MTLAYIRAAYAVPAKRGGRITFDEPTRSKHVPRAGTIVAAADQYLRVRFDDEPGRIHTLHPTWGVTYLKEAPDEPT
ncbi:hypothetical protein GS982_19970 [Rhodococcus hoagii]|nr:hypothetical protein [Prescottella equi]